MLLLAAGATAASIGPEFALDAPIARPSVALAPAAIATDGSGYFVVWREGNNGRTRGIYGARVNASGEVLDPAALWLASWTGPTPDATRGLDVAFDGTNYFVVWDDYRDPVYRPQVRGLRVTPSGQVLDPEGFVVGPPDKRHDSPVVAFDGTNYLVAWTGEGGVSGILGTRVTRQGAILDPEGFQITSRGAPPRIAYNGVNYLVAWLAGSNAQATRVTPEGAILDSPSLLVPGSGIGRALSAASDGQDFLLLWHSRQTTDNVIAARIGGNGTILDPNGFVVQQGYRPDYPAVAFDGTSYVALWSDVASEGYFVAGARISPAGTVLDAVPVLVAPSRAGRVPKIAAGPAGTLAIWSEPGSTPIDATRLTAAATPIDAPPICVSNRRNSEWAPAVARCSGSYLAVWLDDRTTERSLYGVRIADDGSVLDPAAGAFGPVDTASAIGNWDRAVAGGPGGCLVVWHDYHPATALPYDVHGALVPPGEGTITPAPFVVGSQSAYYPVSGVRVASDGVSYLVVWGTPWAVRAFVGPDGAVLDKQSLSLARWPVEMAFGAGTYLLTWGTYDQTNQTNQLLVGRMSFAGDWLDAEGTVVATTQAVAVRAVAFGGTDFLVVWADSASDIEPGIHAARIGTEGTIHDNRLVVGGGDRTNPAACFDGRDWVVSWVHGNSLAAEVGGSWVHPPGADAWPEQSLTATRYSGWPGLASDRAGRTLLVYERYSTELAARRVFGRILVSLPEGSACDTGEVCGSLHCVEGVCCAEACDGPCEGCDASGACVPTLAGEDPDADCTGADGCGGTCDGARGCAFPAETTACGLCAACDGAGSCAAAAEDDPACGAIACSSLSTACRSFRDLTEARCAAVGLCLEPSPETCTAYADASDGTECTCPDGESGTCRAGVCACGAADAGVDAVVDAATEDATHDARALDAAEDATHDPRAAPDAPDYGPPATRCGCRAAGPTSSPWLVLAALAALKALAGRPRRRR